ncbi:MAG: glutaminyl-peptide cyclotransferase [Planctomycetaceae bacterium]|nr:glutaminyl-peptide cyclotransferase [Planctomycetaceae bacterium]
MKSSWKKKGAVLLLVTLPLLLCVTWASGQFRSPKAASYRVIAEYPHDRTSFTQGLIIHNGVMIEGTGQQGKSQLRRVNLKTGQVLKAMSLPDRYFGEGIAVAGDELFQLTWKSRVCFVYDPETLQLKRTVRYAGQGWGLTYDGQSLIMSDGSATLRYFDPKTFRVQKRITVRDRNRPVSDLNELEFVNGEVWANVWYQPKIVRIDPQNGLVKGWIDLNGLKPASLRLKREAVYNGIAFDSENGKLYVTGKNWPKLFEIEIIPR